jgi:hypothetical protein
MVFIGIYCKTIFFVDLMDDTKRSMITSKGESKALAVQAVPQKTILMNNKPN